MRFLADLSMYNSNFLALSWQINNLARCYDNKPLCILSIVSYYAAFGEVAGFTPKDELCKIA